MKRRYLGNEDKYIVKKNQTLILNGILGCTTPVQVEASVGFANFLNHVGINRSNYELFIRLIETNNKWVVDALIGRREPKLLFSTIRPNYYLITKTFRILSFWHPRQIYQKTLHALLGVLEYSYYKSDDGHRIKPLELNDLNNLGKYLDENEDQDQHDNRLILNILDKLTQLGEYQNDMVKSNIAKHAFNIRIAYFDNQKSLLDAIPGVLLVKIGQEENQVSPSEGYLGYLEGAE